MYLWWSPHVLALKRSVIAHPLIHHHSVLLDFKACSHSPSGITFLRQSVLHHSTWVFLTLPNSPVATEPSGGFTLAWGWWGHHGVGRLAEIFLGCQIQHQGSLPAWGTSVERELCREDAVREGTARNITRNDVINMKEKQNVRMAEIFSLSWYCINVASSVPDWP